MPEGVQLGRKKVCIVEIVDDEDEEHAENEAH